MVSVQPQITERVPPRRTVRRRSFWKQAIFVSTICWPAFSLFAGVALFFGVYANTTPLSDSAYLYHGQTITSLQLLGYAFAHFVRGIVVATGIYVLSLVVCFAMHFARQPD